MTKKVCKKVEKKTDLDEFVKGAVTIELDLDDTVLKFLDEKMATGLYLSKGEVVREALRHSLVTKNLEKPVKKVSKKTSKKK